MIMRNQQKMVKEESDKSSFPVKNLSGMFDFREHSAEIVIKRDTYKILKDNEIVIKDGSGITYTYRCRSIFAFVKT